jgi:TctA family transporter
MVLGDKTEDAFRQSMLLSQGSFSIFFSNGLVTTLMVLAAVLGCWGLLPKLGLRRKKPARLAP